MTTPTWAEVLRHRRLPAPRDPGGPLVVLSAHPDDEVLGLGAWLSEQTARPVLFVVATDGEASHPGSPTVTPEELRDVRRVELAEALRALGHDQPDVRHLGLRDAALPDDEAPLRAALAPLLQDAALVLTPYEDDGHADHDVVGRVARDVAPPTATVWRYPVWRWTSTTADADAPWMRDAAMLPVTEEGRARKAAALRAFRSQLEPLSAHPADQPVVTVALLAHALHAPEVVLA